MESLTRLLYTTCMRLPEPLLEAIREESTRIDPASLARASRQLTDFYKAGEYEQAAFSTTAMRVAYLQVRVPATYAANLRVFREIRERAPGIDIRSVLDLGAGSGALMWAASEVFPEIERFTAIERDSEMVEIGRRLTYASVNNAVRSTRWIRESLDTSGDIESHDLVIMSYVLGELSPSAAAESLRTAWARAAKAMIVVEPGTPRNFARVLSFRAALIAMGAHVVAPCPHALPCPMAAVDDWCHFSQRLERTSEHRRMKSATLPYEDEKFSYFVAARSAVQAPDAVIVRHPMKHTGHVQLALCTNEGLQKVTVGKSKKSLYRNARRAEWGDAWQRAPVVEPE